MERITLKTHCREELIDITSEILRVVRRSGIKTGICTVFIPHTTAAITMNENADPAVRTDIVFALRKAFPQHANYDHQEGNSDAHIKSSLIGSSITVFIESGQLALGRWQGIQFCELDGPRTREAWVQLTE